MSQTNSYNVNESERVKKLQNTLRIAISRMMLSSKTKLISIVLYRFKFKIIHISESPLNNSGLACVCWQNVETIDPIPIIWLSTELSNWSSQELSFLIIHEIMHILDRHNRRLLNANPVIKNLAGDHVINTRLISDHKNGNNIIAVPNIAYIIPNLSKENITMEEAYQYLMEHTPNINKGGGLYGLDSTKSGHQNKSVPISKDIPKSKSSKKQDGMDSSVDRKIDEIVDDFVDTIRTASESEPFKSLVKGCSPGSLTEFIKQIIEVKIPWDKILEKAIKTNVRAPSENRSWRNMNKRMRTYGINVPHYANDSQDKSNLYILADHSGSMSKDDLKKMGSLIMQSIGLFNEVVIMKHDTRIVEKPITIDKTSSQEELENALTGKGRGGTSHKCVFDAIQERLDDQYSDEDIGMVLIITDYCSDIETIWSSYEWVNDIPIKIILTADNNVSKTVDEAPILLKSVK